MIIFCAASPEVFFATKFHHSPNSLSNYYFLSYPLVFVVTMGEIDLSFASNFAFVSWIFALQLKLQCRSLHCSSLGIVAGVIGILMGCLVVYGRISSLVASLGALFLIRGFLFVVSDSKSITVIEIRKHWIYDLLVGKLYGFPMQFLWAALFVIVAYFLYHRHVLVPTFIYW